MKKLAYLGLDVHARSCTLGHMDEDGTFRGNMCFPTSEKNIIDALKSIKAKNKYLTMEEGTLTHWAARVARPHVAQVIACDPRENALIFKSPNKRDPVDTRKLCRLLGLGELKQLKCVKFFDSHYLAIQILTSLIIALFVVFILVITIPKLPIFSILKENITQSVKTIKQRFNIEALTQLTNQVSDGELATIENQEALNQQHKVKERYAHLSSENAKNQIDTNHSEVTTGSILPIIKSIPAPLIELNSMKIGPIIKNQELKEVTNFLKNNGFDYKLEMGKGTLKVIRLLEGLYARNEANKRYKELRDLVKSPFIISEKGKYAIYVATYRDHRKAVKKITKLFQKHIYVKPVVTAIPMEGTIIVINDVDPMNIETIMEQVSRMRLSFRVTKSGLI